jgi:PIN domain nuclease of toxin-antitoxin system
MNLLLDTHAFLWYISSDPKLPRYAFDAIRDKSNQVYLSVVSVWEALVKNQTGKLPCRHLRTNTSTRVALLIESLISHWNGRQCRTLLSLPAHHRDPFDRMLICQALAHQLTIVTNDEMFQRYPVSVLRPS